MTPELELAGGTTRSVRTDVEFAHAPDDVVLKYQETDTPGDSYPVAFEPSRLSGLVRPTDRGWVAIAPEIGALGYGQGIESALDDLLDAIEQYLEFLRDEEPELAPEAADHADYVSLLKMPRGLWLASVNVNAAKVE